jgi:hypothetical protein
MNWEIIKPWAAQAARDFLRTVGTGLMSYGVIKDGAGLNAFIGAGMTLAGLFWGWWTTGGAQQMARLLKKLTSTVTQKAAITAAQVLPPAAAVDTQAKSLSVQSVTKALLVAFLLSAVLIPSAFASPLPRPRLPIDPLGLNDKTIAGTVAAPAATGPLTCDFSVFSRLTPANLVGTIQQCVSDTNNLFLPDVTDALASATASNDNTGQQCLKPALAIVSAAVETPGSDAVAATATAPAIAAVPAHKPGVILLFQKFREFTLAGGPTACQNWVNGTISGALQPVAGVAGAALLGGGL